MEGNNQKAFSPQLALRKQLTSMERTFVPEVHFNPSPEVGADHYTGGKNACEML
jgi:hypothetical protein